MTEQPTTTASAAAATGAPVCGLTEPEIAAARARVEGAASAQLTARVVDAATADAALGPLFESAARRQEHAARVLDNFSTTARGLAKRREELGATKAQAAQFLANAESRRIVPLDACLALLEWGVTWRPFLDVTLYPFAADHDRGVVFVATTDSSEAAAAALVALRRHLRVACNACRKNTDVLARLVDARGPVLQRCLRDYLASTEVAVAERAWAARANELHRDFLRNANFVPAFPAATGGTDAASASESGGAGGGGGAAAPASVPGLVDDLLCTRAESFRGLFTAEANAMPVAERPRFPELLLQPGTGGRYLLQSTPMIHAAVAAVAAPVPVEAAVRGVEWPPALVDLYEVVRVFAHGPTYVRTTMQTVKRMSDALEAVTLGPKLSAAQAAEALQHQMLRNANAWALTDGITTKVANRPGAAEDESALSVILNWRCADGSRKKVFDLDLEIMYHPGAATGGGGGGGGAAAAGEVVRIFYGAKYYCTHEACRKSLSQDSGGLCPVDDHGCQYAISLVHDAQHPAGEATEEVKVGAAVRGRITPIVRNFSSADRSYDEANVFKLSLRAGKQFANKVVHSHWRTIQRETGALKPAYRGAGLNSALLKAVGVDDPGDDSDDNGSAVAGGGREHLVAQAVDEDKVKTRLRAGGGIALPLPAELLGSSVRRLDDAETAKAAQVVDDFFGGKVMARMLPLEALDVVWRRPAVAGGGAEAVDVETSSVLQSQCGLPESFVRALGAGAEVQFPVLNQKLLAPAYALEYMLNGATTLPGGPAVNFAAFVTSGLPARDGVKPFGDVAANATGMFTPAEWQRTVQLRGSAGSGHSVVLRAIVRTSKTGYLFFVVEPVAGGAPAVPSENGYALRMPTLPLASRAGRAPNFKEVSHALQLLDGDLAFDPTAAFGFMVQPGMTFTFHAANSTEAQTFESRPPKLETDAFRPRTVPLKRLVGTQWAQMAELTGKTRALFEEERNRLAYATLGDFTRKVAPSTGALQTVYRLVDVRDLLAVEAQLTERLLSSEAGVGGGGGGNDVAPAASGGGDEGRPPRMPPHIWQQKIAKRRREREKRAAAAERESVLLQQKQTLIDGLIEQARAGVQGQVAADAARKVEELRRQREQLAMQRREFEQQQAREKMLVREDMILCPITQEAMRDPVTTPDGTSFEREAIVGWLQNNDTHPCTRQPLSVEQLVPNRALKTICDEYHRGDGRGGGGE